MKEMRVAAICWRVEGVMVAAYTETVKKKRASSDALYAAVDRADELFVFALVMMIQFRFGRDIEMVCFLNHTVPASRLNHNRGENEN